MTKIIFSVDEMLPKLGQCYSLVNNKNSMPILDNVMLSTKEDGYGGYCVVLTTSDNENWLSFKCNLIECDACFKSCVNANDLYKALSNLKDEKKLLGEESDLSLLSSERRTSLRRLRTVLRSWKMPDHLLKSISHACISLITFFLHQIHLLICQFL